MVKIGVGAYKERFLQEWDFCRTHFQVLELQDFIMPDNLDNRRLADDYRALLNGYNGEITLHGPYLNLVPTSLDKKVQEVAAFRYRQGVDLAQEMGATKLVIHSYYDPRPGYTGYEHDWLEDMAAFWTDFLENIDGSGVSILLENCYDRHPASFAGLVARLNHPCFSTCLDIGHCNCFSPSKPEVWMAGNSGYYFHLSDNDGADDRHLVIGQGNIDLERIAAQLTGRSGIYLIGEANAPLEEQFGSLNQLQDMIGARL